MSPTFYSLRKHERLSGDSEDFPGRPHVMVQLSLFSLLSLSVTCLSVIILTSIAQAFSACCVLPCETGLLNLLYS